MSYDIDYPIGRNRQSEADRLRSAAKAAEQARDFEHARELYSRANAVERRERERRAGVSSPWRD